MLWRFKTPWKGQNLGWELKERRDINKRKGGTPIQEDEPREEKTYIYFRSTGEICLVKVFHWDLERDAVKEPGSEGDSGDPSALAKPSNYRGAFRVGF